MTTDVVLPQMGLEVSAGTVTSVHVSVGAEVAEGDALFEVETDKAVTDVEAPRSGVVVSIDVEPGQTVAVGQTLARIGATVDDAGEGTDEATEERAEEPAPVARVVAAEPTAGAAESPANGGAHRIRAAPIARRAAERLGVPLAGVVGTGPANRITLRDVERAAQDRDSNGQIPGDAAEELEPLTPTRAAMARRMTQSQQIPQFALVRDLDATWLLAEKERLSVAGVKVGVVDLLVQALAEAVARHPALATGFVAGEDGEPPQVRRRDGVDVGVAVATERGLLVPVIRGVHALALDALARERGRLVDLTRVGRLGPADMGGATVTLSSLGTFGVDSFTALLNPGESAILAAGRTVDRVVPRDRGLAVVPTMTLTITLDHRVVDGATGARALVELVELLEGGMAWRM